MTTVLIISLITCVGMIASVLFCPQITVGKVRLGLYWLIALVGASVMLLFGVISPSQALAGIMAEGSMNPLKILILFLSMTFLSVFLDELGFFSYAASIAVKKAGVSQRKLFFILFFTVSVLTVFTSNDVIILTFTPFICCFAKNARISPMPYLIAEFVAANTWSMALIIGNPTNVYLASNAGIDFAQYTKIMLLPTVMGGATALLILYLIFNKKLSEPMQYTESEEHISNKTLLALGLIHLALCTALLILSSYLNFEMHFITLVFAISLCIFTLAVCVIRKKSPKILIASLKRAPWELVPFVLSMFIIVLSLDISGVLSQLFTLLVGKGIEGTFLTGFSSVLSANLINNIPMSVLYSSMLAAGEAVDTRSLFAAIAGSNIGAFITPVGALAGIMWSGILTRYKIKFSYVDFVKYGTTVAVPALTATLAGICIVV